jgi:hypothetical protein
MLKSDHPGRDPVNYRNPQGPSGGREPRRGLKPPLNMRSQRPMRTLSLWVLIILLAVIAMKFMNIGAPREQPIAFTEFEQQLADGNLAELTVIGTEIHGELLAPATVIEGARSVTYTNFHTESVEVDREFVQEIQAANPDALIEIKKPSQPWFQIFLTYVFLPILLFFGL